MRYYHVFCLCSLLATYLLHLGNRGLYYDDTERYCNLYDKALSVEDFRGIAIIPVLSKPLEHCILDRYTVNTL